MRRPAPRRRLTLWLTLAALAAVPLASGCAQVRFNQKQRLASHAMKFDPDNLGSDIRGYVLSTREGAVGGFHAGGAGGCGCN